MSSTRIIELGSDLRSISICFFGTPVISLHESDKRVEQAYEKGKREAKEIYDTQIIQARSDMKYLEESLFPKINDEYEEVIKEINEKVPHILIHLFKRIFGNIKLDEDAILEITKEALGEISNSDTQVEVCLSEKDWDLIQKYSADFDKEYTNIRFKIDHGLSRGDCVIQSPLGFIDARVDTKLKKIYEELHGT